MPGGIGSLTDPNTQTCAEFSTPPPLPKASSLPADPFCFLQAFDFFMLFAWWVHRVLPRFPTGKQAKSGLGIEAQRQAVANNLNGGNWRIIAEFTEVESGTRSDRPVLPACGGKWSAVQVARLLGAVGGRVRRPARKVTGCIYSIWGLTPAFTLAADCTHGGLRR